MGELSRDDSVYSYENDTVDRLTPLTDVKTNTNLDTSANAPDDKPLDWWENVLGKTFEKVIELYRSEGAPLIHLGPGENCTDLEKLLSNPDVEAEHLEAVRAWLEKVLNR